MFLKYPKSPIFFCKIKTKPYIINLRHVSLGIMLRIDAEHLSLISCMVIEKSFSKQIKVIKSFLDL